MTHRLTDALALAAVLALVWLVATRLAVVWGPDACWTSCA